MAMGPRLCVVWLVKVNPLLLLLSDLASFLDEIP